MILDCNKYNKNFLNSNTDKIQYHDIKTKIKLKIKELEFKKF